MENLLLSLVLIFSLAYTGLFVFFKVGWTRVPVFRQSGKVPVTTVSILIAARNEEEKLENTIKDILSQNYPSNLFELIIVDDNSTDQTASIIRSFESRGVKLLQLKNDIKLNSYKKKAISEAINESSSELIITTDADCRMGNNWLSTIVDRYEIDKPPLISSPVSYFEEKTWFEEMQTLDFLLLNGIGASAIGHKNAASCNGANLAYKRDVFIELKGFQGIDNLASGDDELFMHKVAVAYPGKIVFCKSKDAIVFTHAKASLKEFILQRKRWASKSTKYKNKMLVALGVLVWFFNLIILLAFLAGFVNSFFWLLSLIAIILKIGSEFYFLNHICKFFGRKNLLYSQPLVSILHIFYLIYIGIAGNNGKYEWKGRMVR